MTELHIDLEDGLRAETVDVYLKDPETDPLHFTDCAVSLVQGTLLLGDTVLGMGKPRIRILPLDTITEAIVVARGPE